MKTKDKILLAAKEIYTQNGYNNTTTRDIAKHLSISPGNLHYHFTHSEQIIKALFEEFSLQMNELLIRTSLSESTSVELFYNYISETTNLFYEYRFIFINFTDILKENPEIRLIYKEIHSRRRIEFENLFEDFKKKKIFKQDIPDFILQNLVDQMFIIGDSALSYNEVSHNFQGKEAIDYYTKIFFNQFYYLFTEEHQKQLEIRLK